MLRFPSNPFLMSSFNKETPNEKGKRVLLGYRECANIAIFVLKDVQTLISFFGWPGSSAVL